MCVKVDRALYGIRDSPTLQYSEFLGTLKRLKLIAYKEEPYLFIDKQRKVIIVFFVNDVLGLYYCDNKAKAQDLFSSLQKAYNIHDLSDIKQFLGV